MPNHYAIYRRSDGWVIAVNGSMLLICERKKAALRAVRDAIARDCDSRDVAAALIHHVTLQIVDQLHQPAPHHPDHRHDTVQTGTG